MADIAAFLDPGRIADGLLVGLGLLLVWLAAIASASIVRSLGTVGGFGIIHAGKITSGWWRYLRGDEGDIVNITLNTTIGGVLSIDTLVSDRMVGDVWPNVYLAGRLRRAARVCTPDDPVVKLRPNGGGLLRRAVKARKTDDTRLIYGPLISMIAESCSNEGCIDLSLGRPMREHRFVVALTYEPLADVRLRHFRVMVLLEDEIRRFPTEMPKVDWPHYQTRFRTLQAVAAQYRAAPHLFGIVKVWRPVAAAG